MPTPPAGDNIITQASLAAPLRIGPRTIDGTLAPGFRDDHRMFTLRDAGRFLEVHMVHDGQTYTRYVPWAFVENFTYAGS